MSALLDSQQAEYNSQLGKTRSGDKKLTQATKSLQISLT
jgi:hypothetical protein